MKKQKTSGTGRAISRRSFLKAGLMGTASLGLSKIPLKAFAAEEKVLVVQTWGAVIRKAMKDAWFDPFTNQTGVKIITADATGSIMPQIKAQVQSQNIEWDLASGLGLYNVLFLMKDNCLEPIDYSIVKKTDLLEDSLHPYGVGCWVMSVNQVYNTTKFTGANQPQNWADFWNVKKFPGPRALTGVPAMGVKDNLAFALLADGVPKDKLSPYDFDRAYKKMDEIKPQIRTWWSAAAHAQQLFTDQEVWLGSMYIGPALQLIKKGTPLKVSWEGGRLSYDYWSVLKNAPHKKTAMEFIEFASQPKQQAEFTKLMYYGPINKKAFDFIPGDLVKDLNTYPANKEKHWKPDEQWLGDNLQAYTERWQAWVAK
jgi:putative spermidine/putrescine transport system substrate-binding protein